MSEQLTCDHTSVGALARDFEGKILLIERKKFPFGWAPPSGHLDGKIYPVACFDEFEEETGLKVVGHPSPVTLFKPTKYFKCRRGGQYHIWQIFEVRWQGVLRPNQDETMDARWCSKEDLEELAAKTLSYLEQVKQAKLLQEELCQAMLKNIEKEWQDNPGLEPVWYEFFKELKIIP